MNQSHLLEETKIPIGDYSPETLKEQFKASYDSIKAQYPQYATFDYITGDNGDGTVSVCLYGCVEIF